MQTRNISSINTHPPHSLSSFLFFILTVFVLAACSNPAGSPAGGGSVPGGGTGGGGTGGGTGGGSLSSAKAITGFSLSGGTVTIDGTTIYVKNVSLYTDETEASVTDLRSLVPVITHTGASVSPAGARNFSGPVSYTVTAADGSTAAYTVIASLEPLDTIGGIGAYLTKAAAVYGGSSAAQPIPLPVDIDLSGWTNLLFAINSAGKYVALDLSACAMTGEFNPSNTSTGKGKIVSLVLPDGATSVKAGTSSIDPAFKDFAALKSVAGAGITSVSEYAFYGCTALSSVNLPAATTVGEYAFYNCTGLTSISLPAATSIGDHAFQSCTALSSVNLPASVTSIGDRSFTGCTSLTSITVAAGNTNYRHSDDGRALLSKDGKTLICYPAASGTVTLNEIETVSSVAFFNCNALSSVNLPAATTVGEFAFYKCTGLTSISLPAAASIGIWAFNYCTALSSVNLPTATSIGQGAFNNTGGTALTVTLGETPPALSSSGTNASATFSKTVTVKTPGAANYDSTWQGNFKKAFGVSYGGYGVAINLTIEDL